MFAVVAHRVTPTNTRLGIVLSPAQAVARLGRGDVALGRLDVLATLDGIEPGLWALERLAAAGVTVLNGRRALVAAHDKLATASALYAAGVSHPYTVHVAPWLPAPELEPPIVFKPRFGSWGQDVIRCDDMESIERTLEELRARPWYEATGGIAQNTVVSKSASEDTPVWTPYSHGSSQFAVTTSIVVNNRNTSSGGIQPSKTASESTSGNNPAANDPMYGTIRNKAVTAPHSAAYGKPIR